jgi:hypothetical protein
MKRAIARIAGATILAGLLFAPTAHASPQVSVRIGIPGHIHGRVVYGPRYRPVYRRVYVARPYRSGYRWQPGYYYVRGYRHWVPGHWVRRW